MSINQIKVYSDLLELSYMNEQQRTASLRKIFERDIENNDSFKFRGKCIRPIKIDGKPALENLFHHLTHSSIDKK